MVFPWRGSVHVWRLGRRTWVLYHSPAGFRDNPCHGSAPPHATHWSFRHGGRLLRGFIRNHLVDRRGLSRTMEVSQSVVLVLDGVGRLRAEHIDLIDLNRLGEHGLALLSLALQGSRWLVQFAVDAENPWPHRPADAPHFVAMILRARRLTGRVDASLTHNVAAFQIAPVQSVDSVSSSLQTFIELAAFLTAGALGCHPCEQVAIQILLRELLLLLAEELFLFCLCVAHQLRVGLAVGERIRSRVDSR